MKRKVVFSLTILISFLILNAFNNSSSSLNGQDYYAFGGRVDCYSTWAVGNDWMIYDCGPCTHVMCDDWMDPGHCRVHPE